jgi:hypothetical protein
MRLPGRGCNLQGSDIVAGGSRINPCRSDANASTAPRTEDVECCLQTELAQANDVGRGASYLRTNVTGLIPSCANNWRHPSNDPRRDADRKTRGKGSRRTSQRVPMAAIRAWR